MRWFSVIDSLPKIGQQVLCFYKIGDFEYFEVGKIVRVITEQTSETEAHKSIEWNDARHNVFEPTHWSEITSPHSGLCPHGVSLRIGDCPKCYPAQPRLVLSLTDDDLDAISKI